MLVLSGGGALCGYQAGAYAAMEAAGIEPDWVAATGLGAVNAAIIAGNPPRERVAKLRRFWGRVGEVVFPPRRERRAGRLRRALGLAPVARPFGARDLRPLVRELVDFARINGGATRLSLAATHVPTGSEVQFDNDRHVLGPEHVLAGAGLAAAPVTIDGEPYGSPTLVEGAPLQLLFDRVAPADTLCFVLDCFDPEPGRVGGSSRARQQIAAFRRRHDLRRALGLVGERLPPDLREDREIAACLAQGSMATMNLVHLVHEGNAAAITERLLDFAFERVEQRWRAGEHDMVASLARPSWLAPPPRRLGVVVHELRSGSTAPHS